MGHFTNRESKIQRCLKPQAGKDLRQTQDLDLLYISPFPYTILPLGVQKRMKQWPKLESRGSGLLLSGNKTLFSFFVLIEMCFKSFSCFVLYLYSYLFFLKSALNGPHTKEMFTVIFLLQVHFLNSYIYLLGCASS